jgi:hypothetical protein
LGSKGVCHVTAKEAENGPEEQSDGHVWSAFVSL